MRQLYFAMTLDVLPCLRRTCYAMPLAFTPPVLFGLGNKLFQCHFLFSWLVRAKLPLSKGNLRVFHIIPYTT